MYTTRVLCKRQGRIWTTWKSYLCLRENVLGGIINCNNSCQKRNCLWKQVFSGRNCPSFIDTLLWVNNFLNQNVAFRIHFKKIIVIIPKFEKIVTPVLRPSKFQINSQEFNSRTWYFRKDFLMTGLMLSSLIVETIEIIKNYNNFNEEDSIKLTRSLS